MTRCLVFVAFAGACGAAQRPAPVAQDVRPGHYRNQIYKIGARIDFVDADHPRIRLDGDRIAEQLDRQGLLYVDRSGRTILRPVDDRSVVVFVHGGAVGVELGRVGD